MVCINRSFESAALEKLENKGSTIGASKETWNKVRDIQVSFYEIDSRTNTTVAKYNESTHTGLTYDKDIKQGLYRIVKNEQTYIILSADPKGRLTQLILKEISNV